MKVIVETRRECLIIYYRFSLGYVLQNFVIPVFMHVLQQGYIFFDIGTRMRKTYCQVDKITMRTAWNYKCSLYNKDIFIIGCLVNFVFIF